MVGLGQAFSRRRSFRVSSPFDSLSFNKANVSDSTRTDLRVVKMYLNDINCSFVFCSNLPIKGNLSRNDVSELILFPSVVRWGVKQSISTSAV